MTNWTKCTAYNERFGATAAGRADLKGSAGMPPLRQAAIPLAVTRDDSVERMTRGTPYFLLFLIPKCDFLPATTNNKVSV